MSKLTVTSTGTVILDGTQTVDTLVAVGTGGLRFATGTVGGRVYDDMAPLGSGQIVVFPAGLLITGFTETAGKTCSIWKEVFGA